MNSVNKDNQGGYDFIVDVNKETLTVGNKKDNDKIELVCKKSLGYLGLGALANSFKSIRGNNNWTKVSAKTRDGKTKKFYIEISSTRDNIKHCNSDNEKIKSLKVAISSWISKNIKDKDIPKIIPLDEGRQCNSGIENNASNYEIEQSDMIEHNEIGNNASDYELEHSDMIEHNEIRNNASDYELEHSDMIEHNEIGNNASDYEIEHNDIMKHNEIENESRSKEIKKIIYDIKSVGGQKRDNINEYNLKELFDFVEDNKNQWFEELNDKKITSMYIKSSQEQIRTIRVDNDGGIYIILKTTLGEGSFKKARLAIDYNNQKLVANVRAKIDKNNSNLIGVIKELTSPVKHKNVVKQSSILEYESYREDFFGNRNKIGKKLSVIMPFYNEIDMDKLNSKNLNSKQKKDIIIGSLKGLKSIHDEGLIHRDIKPANIFIKSKPGVNGGEKRYAAKVGDFGFLTQPSEVVQHSGTQEYIAPEIWREVFQIMIGKQDLVKDKSKITKASDCYSMGVTIAEFLDIPLVPKFVEGAPGRKRYTLNLMMRVPNEGTPEYLVSRLLEPDPEKRMTMEEALALAKQTIF